MLGRGQFTDRFWRVRKDERYAGRAKSTDGSMRTSSRAREGCRACGRGASVVARGLTQRAVGIGGQSTQSHSRGGDPVAHVVRAVEDAAEASFMRRSTASVRSRTSCSSCPHMTLYRAACVSGKRERRGRERSTRSASDCVVPRYLFELLLVRRHAGLEFLRVLLNERRRSRHCVRRRIRYIHIHNHDREAHAHAHT